LIHEKDEQHLGFGRKIRQTFASETGGSSGDFCKYFQRKRLPANIYCDGIMKTYWTTAMADYFQPPLELDLEKETVFNQALTSGITPQLGQRQKLFSLERK